MHRGVRFCGSGSVVEIKSSTSSIIFFSASMESRSIAISFTVRCAAVDTQEGAVFITRNFQALPGFFKEATGDFARPTPSDFLCGLIPGFRFPKYLIPFFSAPTIS